MTRCNDWQGDTVTRCNDKGPAEVATHPHSAWTCPIQAEPSTPLEILLLWARPAFRPEGPRQVSPGARRRSRRDPGRVSACPVCCHSLSSPQRARHRLTLQALHCTPVLPLCHALSGLNNTEEKHCRAARYPGSRPVQATAPAGPCPWADLPGAFGTKSSRRHSEATFGWAGWR